MPGGLDARRLRSTLSAIRLHRDREKTRPNGSVAIELLVLDGSAGRV